MKARFIEWCEMALNIDRVNSVVIIRTDTTQSIEICMSDSTTIGRTFSDLKECFNAFDNLLKKLRYA